MSQGYKVRLENQNKNYESLKVIRSSENFLFDCVGVNMSVRVCCTPGEGRKESHSSYLELWATQLIRRC